MRFRNKILSLGLLLVLIGPIVYSSSQENTGSVLGVIETGNVQNTNQAVNSQSLGNIAGGVIDDVKARPSEDQILEGEVIWMDNLKSEVVSDKFSLASSVVVQYDSQITNLVVGDNSRVLPADAVLAVNKDTFIKIGGDPDNQKSLEVVVTKD